METRVYPDPETGQSAKTAMSRLPNEAYTQVVQSMVIACADVVLTRKHDDEPHLYLARRRVYPMRGYWVIGGRIMFNDQSPRHAAVRNLKRETGLEIDPDHLTIHSPPHLYSWDRVAQGEFAGKNFCTTYRFDATPDELASATEHLDPNEYEVGHGLKRFTLQELMAANAHPMLLDLLKDIWD